MDEILASLPASARVLDLGSNRGSFDRSRFSARTTCVDLESQAPGGVRADAARLPFPGGVFDAVICNHSLEHFANLDAALAEIARVLRRPGGALYVAVPDASTATDRLYRWLARGGGHVNPFTSAPALAKRISQATGLPHRATRTLCTSWSFLNRRNHPRRAPWRLWLLGGGHETPLVWLSAGARWSDRRLGTRLAVYGWALYFGNVPAAVDTRVRSNVCVRCGAGHASDWLEASGVAVRGRWYACPGCRARNRFTRDP